MGILTGLTAGAAALVLLALVQVITSVLLVGVAGYTPPSPSGEGAPPSVPAAATRAWALPLVAGAAALLGGFLVLRFAPEAAGVGTDAAIGAFHEGTGVRLRGAIVKGVASALSLGGGLTSGREGPIAHIGAAAGWVVARVFDMSARDRNIALAAGLGAGIAAIFRAPLAGAILAAEVFYRDDFEVEAFFPGLVASVTGYAVVGYAYGFRPIFLVGALSGAYESPVALLVFAALGVACAAGARLLVAMFRRAQRGFGRRPFLVSVVAGAVATGLLALVFPTVTGAGYGWVQLAISQGPTVMPGASFLAPWPLLVPLVFLGAALVEMVSVSFSVGSGNSGGVFGPCIVTGGFLGAAFGAWSTIAMPGLGVGIAGFAVVGMVAFFAAAAKSPLATIIMIAEMTGGYALLGPSMAAVFTAFVLSGNNSLFRAQVRTRLDSPSHADEFAPFVLRRRNVREVMVAPEVVAPPQWDAGRALDAITRARARGAVVLEDGALRGILARQDALAVPPEDRAKVSVADIMARELVTAEPSEDLFTALEKMLTHDVGMLPVVDPKAPHELAGVVTRREIGAAIAREQSRSRGRAPEAAARPRLAGLSALIGWRR